MELTPRASSGLPTCYFACRDWVGEGQCRVLTASAQDPARDMETYKVGRELGGRQAEDPSAASGLMSGGSLAGQLGLLLVLRSCPVCMHLTLKLA